MSTQLDREDRPRAYHVGNVRTTLLDVAATLLLEGGRTNLNLRTLSNRTGVALGSVYHHFKSKGALLAALAAQGFQGLSGRLSDAAANANERVVRDCVVAYFDFAWRNPALYSLMFETQVAKTELVSQARDQTFQVLETAIAAVPAAQGRSRETIHSISVAVWTCAHGAASLAPIQEEGSDLVEAMISGLEALFRVGREYQGYPNSVQEQ